MHIIWAILSDNMSDTTSNDSYSTATLTLQDLTVVFPFNPNHTQWQYQLNTQYISTYGGYVEQLLSVNTQSMVMEGDAGSRKKVLKLYAELIDIQDRQVESQTSGHLIIPTQLEEVGSISLNVWVANVSLGIDATTTTYPYRVVLQIKDSNYGKLNDLLLSAELNRINQSLGFADGVGFTNSGFYQGLNPNHQLSMSQLSDYLYHPDNVATQGAWNF